jgi:2'-5' RNA ligase
MYQNANISDDTVYSMSFDTTTALSILIPDKFCNAINLIRQKHDKAHNRWMPHINLFFPFVDPRYFSTVKDLLLNIPAICIKLDRIESFKGRVYYLTASDSKELHDMYSKIKQQLGGMVRVEDSKLNFSPHMTIGQNLDKNTIDWLARWIADNPIEFVCRDICILHRNQSTDDKMVIAKMIGLI